MSIHSYPKVWNLGHPNIDALFEGPVLVEEKVDGSQFSFAVIDGRLRFRSRNAEVHADSPGMFEAGVRCISELADRLKPGVIYRGEYLRQPKHNTLHYKRTPRRHVILWDVELARDRFVSREEKAAEAHRVGLEVVPLIYDGVVKDPASFAKFLDTESCLGGPRVEGLVFKNYTRFGADGKILAGKHVSELFKETNSKDWKKRHPGQSDIKEQLGEWLRTEARWRKAVERLRDRGELTNSPQDIGALIREVQQDVDAECEEAIKEKLYQWARKDVLRKSSAGLPEWYKGELVKRQFGEAAQ